MGEPGERLAGLKPPGRSCRRWQLIVCGWICEELRTSACSDGFATSVEASRPHLNLYYSLKLSLALHLEQAVLIPVPLPFLDVGPFIVLLLSLGQGDGQFDSSILPVETEGNEGVALALYGPNQTKDLFSMEQEFSGSGGVRVDMG